MSLSLAATALLPLLGVLVGASVQYFFGRSLENRKHMRAQKGQAYADYFRAFAAIARLGPTPLLLADLADSKTRICIYGGDEVVSRLAEFEREGAETKTHESRRRIATLVEAMRKDIALSGPATKNADVGMVIFGADWKV